MGNKSRGNYAIAQKLTQEEWDKMMTSPTKFKILVTGAGGMLGDAIKNVFKGHTLTLTDKEELDVRYWSDVEKSVKMKYTHILHLAAETDLEICEDDPSHAYMTNTVGTCNMAKLAKTLDIPIVYISTAGIFSGSQADYTEDDIPQPRNHYGRSKLYGEYGVREHEKHYIFRIGWAFGGGVDLDKKFVNKVYKKIKDGERIIYGLDDVFGSPTYTYDLANQIKHSLENTLVYGTYNSAGGGSTSRYGVACALVMALGLEDEVEVVPVSVGYFKKTFHCPRAKSEVLINKRLNIYGMNTMRNWSEALDEYVTKHLDPIQI